jgi:hypothetical protein
MITLIYSGLLNENMLTGLSSSPNRRRFSSYILSWRLFFKERKWNAAAMYHRSTPDAQMEPINLQKAQRKFVLRLKKKKALNKELYYQSLKQLVG